MSDQLMIRIDPKLKKDLDRLSRAEGKTTSGLVRELISDYVKDRDISAYIDGLWDRIGRELEAAGADSSRVAKAVSETRQDRR